MSKRNCAKTLLQKCKQSLLQPKIVTNACKQCKQKIWNCNRNCNAIKRRQIGGFLHFVNNVTFFSYKVLKIEKTGIFILPNLPNLPNPIKCIEKIVTLFTSEKSTSEPCEAKRGKKGISGTLKTDWLKNGRTVELTDWLINGLTDGRRMTALPVRNFGRFTREGCRYA